VYSVPLSLLWQAFGNLNNGGNSGLVCANLNNGLGNANWNIGARACGNENKNITQYIPWLNTKN